MIGTVVAEEAARYRERVRRAVHLAGERPHAAEILAFYRQVLEVQEQIFERVLDGGSLENATIPSVEGLPYAALEGPFAAYVERVSLGTTEELAGAAGAILDAPPGARAELLLRTATQGDLDPLAAGLECPVPQLVFYSRGFLQPVIEALAVRNPGDPATARADPQGACPRCGWPAQVAVLRDGGEAAGRRTLVCGLCATEWPFPRVRCPSCDEEDAGKLVLHETDSVPGLRIAECQGCQAYLKEVDLRKDGHAVPLVEDLATPELDVWAEERGLWKICRNLMGL